MNRPVWPIKVGLYYQGRLQMQRYRNIREIVAVDIQPPKGQDSTFRYLAYRVVADDNRLVRVGQIRTMRVKEFRRWIGCPVDAPETHEVARIAAIGC